MSIQANIAPGRKRFKVFIVKAVYWFLGRGAQAAAKLDSRIAAEVQQWEDGITVMLKVSPNGPSMTMGKRGGRLKYLGNKERTAELTIYFKSIEAAFLILTGRIGIDRGFAEHRYGMRGDINFGMSLVRILNIVEAYLFPGFMTKKILKRMPQKERSSIRVYLSAILGI